MANVLIIGWLIAGVLLSIFSGFLYYNEIITQESFLAIILLGIVILTLFMSSGKRKEKVIKNNKALSDRFFQLMVLSIIIFMIGLFGYLLTLLEMYDLDLQPDFLFLLIIGLMSTLGSFLSRKHVLSRNSTEIEEIDRDLKQIQKDIEKNRNEYLSCLKHFNAEIENDCDFLFCWDNIPGSDENKFKEFLKQIYNINLIQAAFIEKIEDGKTIKVINGKDEELVLKLTDKENEVDFEIKGNNENSYKLIAIKDDNDKINIYMNKIYGW